MRIQVRKCPWTGKIFEEKDIKKYIKHLKEIRIENRHKREISKIRNTFQSWLKEEKEKITHVNMIVPWFMKNQGKLIKGAIALNFHNFSRDGFYLTDKFINFDIIDLHYSRKVSNTHSCPHNGVTNWHSLADLPSGYPGWTGQITGTLKREKKHMYDYPVSSLLNGIGLHTGSGGGGNTDWRFDVKIFVEDWPGLKEQVFEFEGDKIANIIKGVR